MLRIQYRQNRNNKQYEDPGFSSETMTEEELADELRRAKLRALHLLTAMDRTEANLREKLEASYCEETVEKAIAYVKSFGYLDDERYVKNYIESQSRSKSRRQIEQELIFKKGVSKEMVQRGFETAELTDVTEVIQNYMRKKKISADSCDCEQKKKFYAYMMRKGFQIEDLKRVFDLT